MGRSDVHFWEGCQKSVPQRKNASMTAAQPELVPTTTSLCIDALSDEACRLHGAAIEAYGSGRMDEAEELTRRALALFEQAEGRDHPDVAAVLGDLGAMLEDQCRYMAAEACYVRAAAITESMEVASKIDEDDADIERLRWQSLTNLGRIYRVQGRYTQAEPIMRRALNFAERVFGAESLEVSGALNNLGMFGKFAGRFDEASDCYRRALAILEKHYGEDCPEAASIYHNLGGLEHARGRYAEGTPYARKSVALRRRIHGDNHPDVAADTAALAALLDGQGKYAEAALLYQRALAVFEQVYSPEHYEIAAVLNNLAMIYQARGDSVKAEEMLTRTLALKRKIFGGDNVDVAMTINNLAVLRSAQGDDQKAAELYARALSIFEAELGQDHPTVMICRANYADLNGGRQSRGYETRLGGDAWILPATKRYATVDGDCHTSCSSQGTGSLLG
jgi:tetratricopeptide (TPR) repeat protein